MTQVVEAISPRFYPTAPTGPALRPMSGLAYHRVVLVSAHPLFLVGLRGELAHESDFKVVGEVSTAQAVLELAATSQLSLIVLDQTRPGAALPLVRALQSKLGGRVPLVVLGSCETEAQIRLLHDLGVAAFASKALDGPALCGVLRKALQDRRPLPGVRMLGQPLPAWPGRTVYAEKTSASAQPRFQSAKTPLSPREMEILTAIAGGLSNKEVAQALCISTHTLKNHLNNIFKKLEVEDRTQALMLGVRNGWIQL